MKNIVFTGGHHTSALVVAKALRKAGFKIVWLGHKYTMDKVNNPSLEYQQVEKAGIKFIDLKTGKIHRGGLKGWLRLFQGFFQAMKILRKERPVLIVSFGGYLAVPVVLAGSILGIKAVTHEQTVTAGLANRFIKHFVQKIFLAWPDSARFFPGQKIRLVGLPLRPEVVAPQKKRWFKDSKPLVLITGGKQGAKVLNRLVFKALPKLLENYNLVHQTGRTSTTGDWEKAQDLKAKLPAELKKSYQVVDYLTDEEMGRALDQASCVISRAGAHTVYELLVLGKPAVLVPLPFSFAKEQDRNAQKMVEAGLGVVLKQKEATAVKLKTLVDNQVTALKEPQPVELPMKATQKIVAATKQLLEVNG